MRMMWTTCLAALLLATAPQATLALLDPNPDSIGIYFDSVGNTNCTTAALFLPFDAYLIVAGPTTPIDGFECTVTFAGAPHYILEQDLGVGAVDSDPSPGGFAVTAPQPYPVSSGCLVLCRWRVFVMATAPLEFLVGPGTTPTLPYDFPVLFAQGVPRAARTHSCDAQLPLAWINGATCPVCSTYPCISPPFDVLSVGVTVRGPSRTSTAMVATRYEATDGFDEGLDVPRPAPTGPGYLAVSIEHPDWPGGPRFATDKRARFDYGDEFRDWILLVETDLDGPITIERTFSYLVDDFRLRDLQTGQVQTVYPYSGDLLFWNDGTPTVRRYQLISGPWSPTSPVAPDPLSAAVPRLTVSPNPFNPRTTLAFELPAPARAEIRVLTLRGEEVAVLGGELCGAGRHERAWRGLDRAGRAVPSGAYLAQLYVNGAPAGAAARLSLLR